MKSGFSFAENEPPLEPPPVPLNVGVFSVADITQANRRHDLKYGWRPDLHHGYTNAFRLPESVLGELDWEVT